MQGKPLRELILVLVLVALLVPVIIRMTTEPELTGSLPVPEQEQEEMVATTIRLQFAHAPIVAGLGSEVVLRARGVTTEYDLDGEFDFSERLIEWPITVKWPEGTPRSAVTVTFEPDGFDAKELTFWGEGELDEFIELHWHE